MLLSAFHCSRSGLPKLEAPEKCPHHCEGPVEPGELEVCWPEHQTSFSQVNELNPMNLINIHSQYYYFIYVACLATTLIGSINYPRKYISTDEEGSFLFKLLFRYIENRATFTWFSKVY